MQIYDCVRKNPLVFMSSGLRPGIPRPLDMCAFKTPENLSMQCIHAVLPTSVQTFYCSSVDEFSLDYLFHVEIVHSKVMGYDIPQGIERNGAHELRITDRDTVGIG